MEIIERLIDTFKQKFGSTPAHIVHAPGRVNLLGEHMDYNDGFVMPAAINRETFVVFSASGSEQTTLIAADFNEQAQFSPQTLDAKTQPDGSPLPDWARYPAGVAWALKHKATNPRQVYIQKFMFAKHHKARDCCQINSAHIS
jgi:galactokinase